MPSLEASTTVLTNYEMYEGSAQYCWLTNDLAASSKPWKFIFLHHPLATSGNYVAPRTYGVDLSMDF